MAREYESETGKRTTRLTRKALPLPAKCADFAENHSGDLALDGRWSGNPNGVGERSATR